MCSIWRYYTRNVRRLAQTHYILYVKFLKVFRSCILNIRWNSLHICCYWNYFTREFWGISFNSLHIILCVVFEIISHGYSGILDQSHYILYYVWFFKRLPSSILNIRSYSWHIHVWILKLFPSGFLNIISNSFHVTICAFYGSISPGHSEYYMNFITYYVWLLTVFPRSFRILDQNHYILYYAYILKVFS